MLPLNRVVVISAYFPPSASVAAKRPLRFVRELPGCGWDPVVLTAAGSAGGGYDPELMDCLPEGMVLSRAYTQGLFGRWWGGLEDAKGKIRSASMEKLKSITFDLCPLDRFVPFLWQAARSASQLAARWKARCILAIGYPMSSLVAGVLAGRMARLPVVLDLRDPWTLDPLYFPRKPFPIRLLERWLERWCFARAARILLNTERTRDAYRALYPAWADRLFSLPNGFDRSLFHSPAPCPRPGFTLVHFGSFHAGRSLAPILTAMQPDWRLISYGTVPQQDLELAARLGCNLEVRGALPYRRSLGALAEADALLLLQPPETALQIPAKLYDYLCAGRPVLALAANPELGQILRDCRAGIMVRWPDEIAAAVARIRRGEIGPPVSLSRFEAATQGRELAGHLEAACL